MKAGDEKRTFSSHRRGKWRRISRGSVSAVKTMNSETPRFNVLVAGHLTKYQWTIGLDD
jgi:hypothetical protein